ncbi:hypothetical protein GCM10020258_30660 [Sphingomonas yabuuchiae]
MREPSRTAILPTSERGGTAMRWLAATGLMALASPAMAQQMTPPVAAKKPYQVPSPHGAREDEYYWLRDDTRKNPEMLAYLNAENAYADAQLAALKPLEAKLYAETVAHIKQDDSSVPYRKNGYWYSSRFATGADYPLIERRQGSATAPATILFDQPAMAKGHNFFALSDWAVSPDNRLVAWAEDTVGRRQYVLKVKDIATGRIYEDTITNIEPNIVWAADNRTILYIAKDPTTLRGYRAMAHVLGTPVSADRMLYEEKDDSFSIGVGRTTDDRYICIGVQSTVSDEQRCAPAARPTAFTVIAPREREFRYSADHLGHRWIIRTNRGAKNYKLVTLADADMARGRRLARPGARQRRRVHRGVQAVQRLRRHRPARGRQPHDPPADRCGQVRARQGGRARLSHGPVHQRRAGHALGPLYLWLARHADHDL